ncbi:MAG: M56 family metallopeptidase [Bacteroidota bacterium]|nr:M56 family metallopeptidase [Bacteroidota bacterium]
MNESLFYGLKTILAAGAFILIYRLFVRNSNAYSWNRFYLLSTMMFSVCLPFIDISSWFVTHKPIILYASLIDFAKTITIIQDQSVQKSFNTTDVIMTVYGVITLLLLLRFAWSLMRIMKLAKNKDCQRIGNLKLFPVQLKSTFSFFNCIFIQPEHWKKPTFDYIIQHEQAHAKQLHTLDNLLTEIILAFGWFNPFYYVYRRDLHLLHECQADQQVINSGYDKTTYHQLLLNEVSGNLTYLIVNQFSYSLIKRRFKMISKNQQSRLAGFRILLAIPTAFVLMALFSFTSLDNAKTLINTNILEKVTSSFDNQQKPVGKKQAKKTTIKFVPPLIISDNDTVLDSRSAFDSHYPGGYAAWMDLQKKDINTKLLTPKVMGSTKFEVYVKFTVSETGDVVDPQIVRGMNKTCNDEALRIVSMMPKWKPIIKDGNPVRLNYVVPIRFDFKFVPPQVKPAVKPYNVVDQNPEFKGGYDALTKYITQNIHYPDAAKKSGIQGTVFVQFVVEETGKITNVKVLRGIDKDCDREAVRVAASMPDWIPGKLKGKTVPVSFQMPIKFKLSDSK